MRYRTLEVDLENGHVLPRGAEPLPAKARALLTILELPDKTSEEGPQLGGLKRFLSAVDFPLTADQFRASMEADIFEQ
jgi:hypothetical protein